MPASVSSADNLCIDSNMIAAEDTFAAHVKFRPNMSRKFYKYHLKIRQKVLRYIYNLLQIVFSHTILLSKTKDLGHTPPNLGTLKLLLYHSSKHQSF